MVLSIETGGLVFKFRKERLDPKVLDFWGSEKAREGAKLAFKFVVKNKGELKAFSPRLERQGNLLSSKFEDFERLLMLAPGGGLASGSVCLFSFCDVLGMLKSKEVVNLNHTSEDLKELKTFDSLKAAYQLRLFLLQNNPRGPVFAAWISNRDTQRNPTLATLDAAREIMLDSFPQESLAYALNSARLNRSLNIDLSFQKVLTEELLTSPSAIGRSSADSSSPTLNSAGADTDRSGVIFAPMFERHRFEGALSELLLRPALEAAGCSKPGIPFYAIDASKIPKESRCMFSGFFVPAEDPESAAQLLLLLAENQLERHPQGQLNNQALVDGMLNSLRAYEALAV